MKRGPNLHARKGYSKFLFILDRLSCSPRRQLQLILFPTALDYRNYPVFAFFLLLNLPLAVILPSAGIALQPVNT